MYWGGTLGSIGEGPFGRLRFWWEFVLICAVIVISRRWRLRWHGGGVEADRGATLKWYCRAPNAATNPFASQSMRPPNSTAYTMLLFCPPKRARPPTLQRLITKKMAETPSQPAVENDITSDVDNTLFPLVVLLMSMLANTASNGAVEGDSFDPSPPTSECCERTS